MFYSYNITVTTSHAKSSPKEDTLYLAAGVIHQVDIVLWELVFQII